MQKAPPSVTGTGHVLPVLQVPAEHGPSSIPLGLTWPRVHRKQQQAPQDPAQPRSRGPRAELSLSPSPRACPRVWTRLCGAGCGQRCTAGETRRAEGTLRGSSGGHRKGTIGGILSQSHTPKVLNSHLPTFVLAINALGKCQGGLSQPCPPGDIITV